MSKAKLVAAIAMIIGGIGALISDKAEDLARDEMKAELKEELLNELKEGDS